LGDVLLKVFKALFGCMGWMIMELFKWTLEALIYVPKKLGDILVACGSSVRNGGKEVMVWIDPKRV
jgi:hypothetical protein